MKLLIKDKEEGEHFFYVVKSDSQDKCIVNYENFKKKKKKL